MSTTEHAHNGVEPTAAHGGEGHEASHGSLRDYLIGFGLSVVLTAIPFWLVMSGVIESKQTTAFTIMAFAAVQIVVHMIYFLHMNSHSEEGWTLVSLIFTLILVVITLAGSLWVMFHLNTNMMPTMDMSQIP